MSSSASSSALEWTWSLGLVQLEVRHGNLLESTERAWVNSEQTDFQLARDESSISSQLRRLWPAMQAELDEQSRGGVHPPGTVLLTSGPEGRIVFHAGFHDPCAWYFGGDDDLAIHLDAIRSCTERILDEAERRQMEEVAFSLIGTGVFSLPVRRVAEQLFDAVLYFARRTRRSLRIVIYVLRQQDVPVVVLHGTRTFAARLTGGGRLVSGEGGHPLVQAMRRGVREQVGDEQSERELLAFAEIALSTDLAAIADDARLSFASLLRECQPRSQGCRLTFGLVRDRLSFLSSIGLHEGSSLLASRLDFLSRHDQKLAIQRLVMDRNDFAHHRKPRDTGDIVADVELLFGAEAMSEPWPEYDGHWLRRIGDEHGLLQIVDFARGMHTWLMPLSRRHHSEPPHVLASS